MINFITQTPVDDPDSARRMRVFSYRSQVSLMLAPKRRRHEFHRTPVRRVASNPAPMIAPAGPQPANG